MNVGVCRVLSQVLLLILLLAILSRPVSQDIHLKFIAFRQIKTVHGLSSYSCLFMALKFNDGVTMVLTRVRVLGQLNSINLTERLKKLADVLLRQL